MKKYLCCVAVVIALLLIVSICGCGSDGSTGNSSIGGEAWTDTGGEVSGYMAQAITFDPENGILYAGFAEVVDLAGGGVTEGRGVWKYDGDKWANTKGAISEYHVQSLACDVKHNLIYASCYKLAPGEISGNEPKCTGVWKYNGKEWTDTGISPDMFREAGAFAYDSVHNNLYASFNKAPSTACVWKYDGKRWADVGGDLSDYMVTTLACDGKSNLVYAGTRGNGGVLKFDGIEWTNTGGGLSGFWINCLVYDDVNNILYASTGSGTAQVEHFGHGVWKYDGENWVDTGGEVTNYSTGSLAVDSTNNVVYATCFQDIGGRGIWKYDGNQWINISSEMTGYNFGNLAYDSNDNMLYTGCFTDYVYDGKGVWKYDPSKANL